MNLPISVRYAHAAFDNWGEVQPDSGRWYAIRLSTKMKQTNNYRWRS